MASLTSSGFTPAMTGPEFSTSAPLNIVHGTHSQLIAWLVLNIWPSHFAIPLLLVVIMVRKIERNATFINLCITFIIVGISSSLLAYAGRLTGQQPAPVLCLLQASLLYGYPPMSSVAAFALVLQMFLVVRGTYYGKKYIEKEHIIRTWALITAPYFVFVVVVLATTIVGAANPFNVSRDRRFFYCSVLSNALTNTLTVFAAIFLFGTVFAEGWLSYILCKRYIILKSKGFSIKEEMSYSMPIRVLAFGLYSTVAFSLSLLSIRAPESPVPDMMIATAPSVFVLIFATQRDIIKGLCIWQRQSVEINPVQITVVAKEGSEKINILNGYNVHWAEEPGRGEPVDVSKRLGVLDIA